MTTYTHAIASIYGSISSRWNFKIKPYVLIALALVIFLVIQHYYNIHWGVLTELQKNGLYKQFTGILLFLLVAQQWQLAYVHSGGVDHRHPGDIRFENCRGRLRFLSATGRTHALPASRHRRDPGPISPA